MLYHNLKKKITVHTQKQSKLYLKVLWTSFCPSGNGVFYHPLFCGFQFSAFWGEIFGGKKATCKKSHQKLISRVKWQSPCCADQPACLPLCCSLNVASGPTSGWKVTLTRGVEEILLTYECTLTKGQQGNTGNEGALDVAFSFCEVALEHVRSPIMRIGHSKANRQI